MPNIPDQGLSTQSRGQRRRRNSVRAAARRYLQRGWAPIPLPPGCKQPHIEGWTNLRLAAEDLATAFRPGANIGVLLGEPSRGLEDVDLDCVEAMTLAPRFLPLTGSRFGRMSKPESHWLYYANPIPQTRQFRDLNGSMLLELRSTEVQTMFPPSRHPSGERVRWDQDGQPANVDGRPLERAVARLAAAVLLARTWPAMGSRQEAALALAGGLLRLGWASDEVDAFIAAVAQAAGDEESAKRASAASYTPKRLEAGQPATGWPRLAELIGEPVVARAQQWLDSRRAPRHAQDQERPHLTDFAQLQEAGGRYVISRQGRRGTTSEEPISNWAAEPVERLRYEDGSEVLRLRAHLVGTDETVMINLPAKALSGRRELIAAFPSTEWVWTGTEKHVQFLRAHWRWAPTRRRQATSIIGRHDRMIVLPGGTFGPDGPLEPAPLIYLEPSGVTELPFAQTVRAPWAAAEVVQLAKRAVARFLPRVNCAAVMVPIVGWFGALPWATLYRERAEAWGGFPHLVIFGSQGGGKTSLGRLLWRLCGMPLTCEPMSMSSTQFARLRALGATNLLPVWIDEYRPSAWSPAVAHELHHELRMVYSGEALARGLPTLGIRTYRLRAPIILSGEDWPADTALRERVLAVNPNPESLKDREASFTAAFRLLQGAPVEAFALAYWTWALAQDDWLAEAEQARRWVQRLLDGAGCQLPARAANNLSICAFGLQMLRRFFERPLFVWVGGSVADALLQQAQLLFPGGDRRLPLDDLLLRVASQAHTTLKYGHHWVLAADRVILRLDAVVDDLREYVRRSGHPTEILSAAAYRRQASELHKKRGSYVLEMSQSAKFLGDRVLRGVALSPAQMAQTLQIDPGLWHGPRHRQATLSRREE